MTAILRFFRAVPLRWWLYAAAAAAFAFVLWREQHQADRANRLEREKRIALAERDQLRDTIEIMTVDEALRKETTHALAERLADVERDRRDHPLSLRCAAAAPARMPEENRGAGRADDSATGPVAAPPLRDFGPALSDGWHDCTVTAEKLRALQAFEAARTH